MTIWWLILATICIFICWRDYKHRVISNKSVLLLLGLLLSTAVIRDSQLYFAQALLVLLLGIVLWKFGVFGAGDIKLASTFALLIDPNYLMLTFVIMFLLGGIEALLYILIRKLKPISIVHDGLPFAIPIVISGVFGIGASI